MKSLTKKSYILIVLATLSAIFSSSYVWGEYWITTYEDGDFIEVTGIYTVQYFDENNNLVEEERPIPEEWINMAWTPKYLESRFVRTTSDFWLKSYGDVTETIKQISEFSMFLGIFLGVFPVVFSIQKTSPNVVKFWNSFVEKTRFMYS